MPRGVFTRVKKEHDDPEKQRRRELRRKYREAGRKLKEMSEEDRAKAKWKAKSDAMKARAAREKENGTFSLMNLSAEARSSRSRNAGVTRLANLTPAKAEQIKNNMKNLNERYTKKLNEDEEFRAKICKQIKERMKKHWKFLPEVLKTEYKEKAILTKKVNQMRARRESGPKSPLGVPSEEDVGDGAFTVHVQ